VIMWVQLLEVLLSTNFCEGKKRPKCSTISDYFFLLSLGIPEQINIMKIEKACDQLRTIPYWMKKVGELWSTNKKL